MEEYVRVFEPLLFEECRAQLYSTWEESTETVSRDTHIMVRVKANESRERGTLVPFSAFLCKMCILVLLLNNLIVLWTATYCSTCIMETLSPKVMEFVFLLCL